MPTLQVYRDCKHSIVRKVICRNLLWLTESTSALMYSCDIFQQQKEREGCVTSIKLTGQKGKYMRNVSSFCRYSSCPSWKEGVRWAIIPIIDLPYKTGNYLYFFLFETVLLFSYAELLCSVLVVCSSSWHAVVSRQRKGCMPKLKHQPVKSIVLHIFK